MQFLNAARAIVEFVFHWQRKINLQEFFENNKIFKAQKSLACRFICRDSGLIYTQIDCKDADQSQGKCGGPTDWLEMT